METMSNVSDINSDEINKITTNIRIAAQRKLNAILNCEMTMAEGAECQCGEHSESNERSE